MSLPQEHPPRASSVAVRHSAPDRAGDHDPRLSVVVPVYNEGDEVGACLDEIRTSLRQLEMSHELIVVDDGSNDGTWTALERFAAEHSDAAITLVQLSRNFGKEAAICSGLDVCRGEAVIVMDADLQHPPSLIPRMVELWQSEDVDIVEAVKSRRAPEPLIDRFGSWLFYRLLATLTGVRLAGASDFKLLSRRVLDSWRAFGESETFFRGLVAWLGFKRTQLTFDVPERRGGGSRWSTFKRVRLAVLAITSFSSLPLQLITVAGCLLFLISTVFTLQALHQKWQGIAVEGFTTVIILTCFIGSTIMVSLGIIGLYIARIYNEIKRRPRYVVARRGGSPEQATQ